MLTITCICVVVTLDIHGWGIFDNCTAHSLYNIMFKATSIVSEMKTGNIGARAGIKPTSLAVWVSVPTWSVKTT